MRRAQDRARSARSRKNGARSAMIESRALGALKLAREARNENVPAKRADFFCFSNETFCLNNQNLIDLAKCIVSATKEFCCINTNKFLLLIWKNFSKCTQKKICLKNNIFVGLTVVFWSSQIFYLLFISFKYMEYLLSIRDAIWEKEP